MCEIISCIFLCFYEVSLIVIKYDLRYYDFGDTILVSHGNGFACCKLPNDTLKLGGTGNKPANTLLHARHLVKCV